MNNASVEFAADKLAEAFYQMSTDKGFYDSLDMSEFNSQAKQLMMLTSEVVEVMEALRKDKGEAEVLAEMADIFIRYLDFYAALVHAGVLPANSLVPAIWDKYRKNAGRPGMHGVKG